MKFTLLTLLAFLSLQLTAQNINWSSPIDVSPSTNGNKYPRIVNNTAGEIFVSWGGNNNVYLSKNTGSGFSNAVQINNISTPAYVADWTGPELDVKGDSVYVVFMHNVWKQKTYLSRSFDGGQNFSSPTNLENYPDSTSRFPCVAISPNGQPLISFMKMDTNGKHPHYVFRESTDFGTTFGNEKVVGNTSGPTSEACDCCPGAIKAVDNKVAVFYRDNLNDIRDIYVGVSSNNGNTFNDFAIDNNAWFIQSCPSSGPDGAIIGDSIYSVFLSGNKSYLSRSSISGGSLNAIEQLGATAGATNQNYPRIDNNGNKTAVVWRGISGGTKLMFSYTADISNGTFEIQDTLVTNSLANADLAVTANAVHVVWQDITTGTVKYSKGTFGPSAVNDISKDIELSLYPNPAKSNLEIKTTTEFVAVKIYNTSGQIISENAFAPSLDISKLANGNYIIELITDIGAVARQSFSKQ